MTNKTKAKVKTKVGFSQNKALCRNWSKGILVGTLTHFAKMQNLNKLHKALSMTEQLKLIKAKKLLEEILTDWKPTL